MKASWGRLLCAAMAAVWLAVAYWNTHKPLPPGLRIASAWSAVPAQTVTFIPDISGADAYGRSFGSHAIFDQLLQTIAAARQFVLLDYRQFNDMHPATGAGMPPLTPLAAPLRDALIARRRAVPALQVLFITDPINDLYGTAPSTDLALLRAAGISVAVTDLAPLRDPNFLYSSLWRLTMKWWSTPPPGGGWLPDPFSDRGPPLTLRAWGRLANLKANDRKVLIADDGHGGLTGILSSADPALTDSADSNVALRLSGPALGALVDSEMAVARLSGWNGTLAIPAPPPAAVMDAAAVRVQLLTDGAIRGELLRRLGMAGHGDAIDIAMYALADGAVIDALLAASRRGAAVRVILDPDQDDMGAVEAGFPNQPVASELLAASGGAIRVAWYRTHGERFHATLVMIHSATRMWLTLGSANLTRRSLGGYDLEANAALAAAVDAAPAQQALQYFDTLWNDRGPPGIEYTADADTYADPSQLRYWAGRLMEATGISTY